MVGCETLMKNQRNPVELPISIALLHFSAVDVCDCTSCCRDFRGSSLSPRRFNIIRIQGRRYELHKPFLLGVAYNSWDEINFQEPMRAFHPSLFVCAFPPGVAGDADAFAAWVDQELSRHFRFECSPSTVFERATVRNLNLISTK
jgi:hypothetical protein